MDYQHLNHNYIRGKQIICIFAIVVSILGFILDGITYHTIYSASQFWLQSLTVFLCLVSLAFYLVDRNRYYVLAYGLLSYGVIINILFTTLYIHTFVSFSNFTQANILSRDILFVTLYIVLTGFIIGRYHIFIQGALLMSIISYFIFILKEDFFVSNAAIYLTATFGFLFVLQFFVRTINHLIVGLEESNKVAHELKQIETYKKQRLIEYQNSILHLAQDESLFKNNLQYLFEKICTTAATDLGISRVGIWSLEENNTKLIRKYLIEDSIGTDHEMILDRRDFPAYFNAVEKHPLIDASDAILHADTKEFKDMYLLPLGIVSMLDCPVVVDGKAVGVICCETQRTRREWSSEDILYVQSLSVHISICYKNLLINELLTEVRQRNVELVEKGNEIESMNEELNSLNEELITLNDNLESTVKRRTSELETQNKQLTEYAFINSHILRAPLARILGLANIISIESDSVKDKRLLDGLIASSNELDTIIRKISDILYDGNNLSREDIQLIIDRTINKVT